MKISQREARRLRARCKDLETILRMQRNAWAAEFVGGVHLGDLTLTSVGAQRLQSCIHTARKLGHAVVVNTSGDEHVRFYALRLPEEGI